LLYYIIPFVISLGVLGIREILLSRNARRLSQRAAPALDNADARVEGQSNLS
jgi:hypothetical protein